MLCGHRGHPVGIHFHVSPTFESFDGSAVVERAQSVQPDPTAILALAGGRHPPGRRGALRGRLHPAAGDPRRGSPDRGLRPGGRRHRGRSVPGPLRLLRRLSGREPTWDKPANWPSRSAGTVPGRLFPCPRVPGQYLLSRGRPGPGRSRGSRSSRRYARAVGEPLGVGPGRDAGEGPGPSPCRPPGRPRCRCPCGRDHHRGLGMGADLPQGRPHHQWVELADVVGVDAGGLEISAATEPVAGSDPSREGRSGRGWWR